MILENIDGNISDIESKIKENNIQNSDTKDTELKFKVCITELQKIIKEHDVN